MRQIVVTTLVAAAAVLLLSPLAPARTATVGASAQVARTGNGYTLTLRNTGTESIRCFLVLLPTETTPGTVTPPSGWQATVTPTSAIVGYGLPGTAGAPGPGLAPGATAQFAFTASGDAIGPTPAADGMLIRLNPTNCAFTASNALASPISGPAASGQPPATTTPSACACSKLSAVVTKVELLRPALADPKEVMILRLRTQWTMQCTGGTGACTGTLTFGGTVPEMRQGLLVSANVNYNGTLGTKTVTVGCRGSGTCSGAHTGVTTFYVAGNGAYNAKALGAEVKRIVLLVRRTCKTVRAPLTIAIAFGPGGKIDGAKSDLNGDRKPDA